MFEGKHIHFSPVDNKPLCSYSNKLCKQHRLNGYAFCIRHILEDKSAPFKQCAYVAKYNKQKCTNPIPSNEERGYCNSHMQVAGMAPKKERRCKKDKMVPSKEELPPPPMDGRLKFSDRLKALLKSGSNAGATLMDDSDEPEDPYAFSEPEPVTKPEVLRLYQNASAVHSKKNLALTSKVYQVSAKSVKAPVYNSEKTEVKSVKLSSNANSQIPSVNMATLYPALSASLGHSLPVRTGSPNFNSHVVNSKVGMSNSPVHKLLAVGTSETKVSDDESSKTMNRLQAKIAQNKVIGKHKKVCSSSQGPNSSHHLHVKKNLQIPQTYLRTTADMQPRRERSLLEEQLLGLKSEPNASTPCKTIFSNRSIFSTHSSQSALKKEPRLNHPSPSSPSHRTSSSPVQQPSALQTVKPSRHPITYRSHHNVSQASFVTIPAKRSRTKGPQTQGSGRTVQKDSSRSEVLPFALTRLQQIYDTIHEYKQDLYPLGLEVSESEDSDSEAESLVQRHWFYSSMESEGTPPDSPPFLPFSTKDSGRFSELCLHSRHNEGTKNSRLDSDGSGTNLSSYVRSNRLSQVKAEFRRRYNQYCNAELAANVQQRTKGNIVNAVVEAARKHPNKAAAFLQIKGKQDHRKVKNRSKMTMLIKTACSYRKGEDDECTNLALPCTRHCVRHIMYNVDQLLFEHCTAKFSDNTQCCVPVFDICHELPLCIEHARKRDNYDKMCAETKPKKARKKAKTSAMTRPGKRGKKKRRINNVRSRSPESSVLDLSVPQQSEDADMNVEEVSSPADNASHYSLEESADRLSGPENPGTAEEEEQGDIEEDTRTETFENSLPEEPLSPDTMSDDRGLELPLDTAELASQASRLLEEHDLTNVLNQIPADAFNDLFTEGKNGEYEPTKEETEELERALAAVDKDVKSLEKLSQTQGLSDLELQESILNANIDEHTLSQIAQGNMPVENINSIATSMPSGELTTMSQVYCSVNSDPVVQSAIVNPALTESVQNTFVHAPSMVSSISQPTVVGGMMHNAIGNGHNVANSIGQNLMHRETGMIQVATTLDGGMGQNAVIANLASTLAQSPDGQVVSNNLFPDGTVLQQQLADGTVLQSSIAAAPGVQLVPDLVQTQLIPATGNFVLTPQLVAGTTFNNEVSAGSNFPSGISQVPSTIIPQVIAPGIPVSEGIAMNTMSPGQIIVNAVNPVFTSIPYQNGYIVNSQLIQQAQTLVTNPKLPVQVATEVKQSDIVNNVDSTVVFSTSDGTSLVNTCSSGFTTAVPPQAIMTNTISTQTQTDSPS